MGVKFFGQFLIEQGEVDAGHVKEALDLLAETNRNIGHIAVSNAVLSDADCERVILMQRTVDKPFGDLAVEMGLLSSQELVDCLRQQRESRMLIGEALIKLGHLPEDQLGVMLDAFKVDQAAYEVGVLKQLPDPLANNRVAPYILDLLPKFALRIAVLTIKVGEPQLLGESPAFPFCVSVPIHGHRGLDITLVGDRVFSLRLAAASAKMHESAMEDELIADGLGEFLNVICGNAMSALERDGVPTELGVPDYDAELSDGWIFDLATSHGRAALVLSQF